MCSCCPFLLPSGKISHCNERIKDKEASQLTKPKWLRTTFDLHLLMNFCSHILKQLLITGFMTWSQVANLTLFTCPKKLCISCLDTSCQVKFSKRIIQKVTTLFKRWNSRPCFPKVHHELRLQLPHPSLETKNLKTCWCMGLLSMSILMYIYICDTLWYIPLGRINLGFFAVTSHHYINATENDWTFQCLIFLT